MTEEKQLDVQEILEKTIKHVDLSIVAYLATMIQDAIGEKQMNQISDIDKLLQESLFTYQICKDETEAYTLCQTIFQELVKYKCIRDPEVVKKEILKSIKVGDILLGQYSEDGQWYVAKVDQLTDSEIQVTYTDYGNTEWLDPFAIQLIDKVDPSKNNSQDAENGGNNDGEASNSASQDPESADHSKSSLLSENIRSKQGIKLSDNLIVDDVSQKINSLMYQSNRFLTDTARGQKELSSFGLTSQQKRKMKEEMKEKEKVLRFDPTRYLKEIRQKARPEWFDLSKRKGSKSVRIADLVMYTLDEKELLLNGVEFNLEFGRKYGLIGLNGCGKTTLLRRISRYDLKQFPAHLRVLHVEQEIIGDEQTVLNYVLSCDVVRNELVEQEQALLQQKNELIEKKVDNHEVLDKKLQQLYDKMRELDVLDVEHKAKKVLEGLGFRQEMLNWPTNRLSGGWRMRAALAGALFVHPDVLLLDEPTNHLDFPSVIWLENYLREEFTNTLLVVSHDREFLNSVVDRIIHMEKQTLREYPGNFKHFLQTRQMEYEMALKNYENQQEEIQHHKRFIDRFRASAARAASVQSRIKMLNAMERFQKPEKPFTLQFDFPQCSHTHGDIISLRNVTFGYNSKEILLNGISRSVDSESRIGVIGANGAGKSTLIYLMLEQLKPIKGDVIRNRKARVVLFTQHHIDQLDLSMSPMDFLLAKFADDCKKEKRQAEYVRGKLGAFGLSGDIVDQRMMFLSGGQKSRVAFTVLTWENPNFIIMDEPTNHLDMETIDALIDAIHRWNGGILVVSHDQHFLMNIAKKFWSLSIKSATIEEFSDLNKAKEFAARRS